MIESQIQQLTQIIQQLRKAYEKFLLYSEKQRKDIVNNDLDELNATNRAIDEALTETQELEQQRLLFMGHLELHAGQKFAKADEIHLALKTPESEVLVEAVNHLKMVLEKVAKSHQVNQRLIRSSREFIRSNMAIITGHKNRGRQQKFNTYGTSGQMSHPGLGPVGVMNQEV